MTLTQTLQFLRVGIIGASEVAQAIHLRTLSLLAHLYTIVAICDISPKTVEHCKTKLKIPFSAIDPYELIALSNVNLIFILTSV